MDDPFFTLKCWCGERHRTPDLPNQHKDDMVCWRKIHAQYALALLENGHWPDPDWLRVTLLDIEDASNSAILKRGQWPTPAKPGQGQ